MPLTLDDLPGDLARCPMPALHSPHEAGGGLLWPWPSQWVLWVGAGVSVELGTLVLLLPLALRLASCCRRPTPKAPHPPTLSR
jgi:hypothetical protein